MRLSKKISLNDKITLLKYCVYNPNVTKLNSIVRDYSIDENRFLLGLIDKEDCIGILGALKQRDNQYNILHLAIKPEYQRIGIGTLFISKFIESFQPSTITLETDNDALKFYLKIGFQVVNIYEKFSTVRYVLSKKLV